MDSMAPAIARIAGVFLARRRVGIGRREGCSVMQRLKEWRWPLLLGLVGWSTVFLTRTDPGITSDEPFSVLYGMDLVDRFRERGRGFFSRDSINEAFATRKEHPPLGRWLFGWTHRAINGRPDPSDDFGVQDILDSRVATGMIFGLMLVILGRVVAARHGTVAGMAAGCSLILMPRVFAHAHFAALDTLVSCTYMLAVLSGAWMMEHRRPWLCAPVAGILLGCALLTKMHGLFLLPLVGLWALACYRTRSVLALGLWFTTGVAIFFAGWPWLWGDLAELWSRIIHGVASERYIFPRLSSYLGSSVAREAIYVSYGGGEYRDAEVPWHYPWVMFAVTVPVGLLVLGVCGVWRQLKLSRSDARGWLMLAAWLFPLVVFSVPGIPVYDGVRLFLMVFPFWAIFVGQAAGWAYEWLTQRWQPRWAAALLGSFFACQGFGLWYYHPFQLSYYNLLVGGLRGADRLGFEVTYWGDSVTTDLIDRWAALAPKGSCAVFRPTLYTGQGLLYLTADAHRKELTIRPQYWSACPYLIVYNRRAYLSEARRFVDDPAQKPLLENARDGVWLSRVYVRAPQSPSESSDEER
jgi:4-amino-4-deoxy-L-arabinose transferase-like glycosyltransferase